MNKRQILVAVGNSIGVGMFGAWIYEKVLQPKCDDQVDKVMAYSGVLTASFIIGYRVLGPIVEELG